MPKFSLIISCYNQEQMACDAVESALTQAIMDKEVIVTDDASTDGTARALEKYGDKIQLIKFEKNQGANRARNAGAARASGDYLVFLDGDDLFLPWALDVYAHILELRKPRIILCRLLFFRGAIPVDRFSDFGESLQITEYDALVRKDRSYRGSASAIVIDRRLFQEVGGWTDDIWPSEIDDLTMKVGYSGRTVHILSHPTVAYRLHAANTMHQVYRFIDTMSMVANKERRGEYPGGPAARMERYAYIGGPLYFWVVKGFRAGLYSKSMRLFFSSWRMIMVAIISRLKIRIFGPRPAETIQM